MFSYNPDFRWSAKECLNSAYFDSIRKPELEKEAPYQIKLKIDEDGNFDYEKSKTLKFHNEQVIEMIF